MNILKEEKPLIEWEKELDIWLVDLDLKEHLNLFNKIDAFSKISISKFKRGWSRKHYDLYYTIMLNKSMDSLVLDEFKTCYKNECLDMYEEKLLIEWEKEYNVWINDLEYNDHFRKYCRYQVDSKLKRYLSISKWNNDAQKIYDNYQKIKNGNNDDSNCLDTNKDVSIKESSMVDSNNIVKTSNISKKKNSNHKIIRNVKSKKCKNKVKLRNSLIKKSIAIALTISSFISVSIFSKLDMCKNRNLLNQDVKACNNIDNSSVQVGGLFNNFSSFKNNFIDNTIEDTNIINTNNLEVNKISDDLKTMNDYIIKDIKNNYISSEIIDNAKMDNDVSSNIRIGDSVLVSSDSCIYDNCIDAMNCSNGMDPYFSYDFAREVSGVCLNYNDQIIYSLDNDEIENYANMGASVVSYCTSINDVDEGFYSVDDIKILKKQC